LALIQLIYVSTAVAELGDDVLDAILASARRRNAELQVTGMLLYSRGTIGFTDFSDEEKARLGSAPQPLVRVHPGSGRKTLYLASHAMMIHGMEVPEGRILLKELMDHATRPEFVYTHIWTAGDLVLWDNRCTMHRACEYDPGKIRELHRTTVMEETPPMAERTRNVA